MKLEKLDRLSLAGRLGGFPAETCAAAADQAGDAGAEQEGDQSCAAHPEPQLRSRMSHHTGVAATHMELAGPVQRPLVAVLHVIHALTVHYAVVLLL